VPFNILDVRTTIEGYPKLWVMKLGTENNLIRNHPLIKKPKLKLDPIFIIKKLKSK
jgi:hypothetical protein